MMVNATCAVFMMVRAAGLSLHSSALLMFPSVMITVTLIPVRLLLTPDWVYVVAAVSPSLVSIEEF